MPYSRRYAGRSPRACAVDAAVLRSVSHIALRPAMSAAADHDYLTKLAVFRALQ